MSSTDYAYVDRTKPEVVEDVRAGGVSSATLNPGKIQTVDPDVPGRFRPKSDAKPDPAPTPDPTPDPDPEGGGDGDEGGGGDDE